MCLGAGCRAHPISLALTLAGDVIDGQEIDTMEPALLGEPAAAADEIFGLRHDTLIDRQTGGRWLVYAEAREDMAESFYVVETAPDETITNLFKCKRNIDGLEDLYKIRELEHKTIGATREECEQLGSLGEPIYHLFSTATGYEAYFYDARNITHTRLARYWILCLDPQERCWEIRMIGVTAD